MQGTDLPLKFKAIQSGEFGVRLAVVDTEV